MATVTYPNSQTSTYSYFGTTGEGAIAMTSDGISAEDWDAVHELVLEVVNAEEEEEGQARRRLRSLLMDLKGKYGDLPSLLATEADFEEDLQRAEYLYLRAFDLALGLGDEENVREVALSLAEHYASDCHDRLAAERWLEIICTRLRPNNESDHHQYRRIREAIERLPRLGN